MELATHGRRRVGLRYEMNEGLTDLLSYLTRLFAVHSLIYFTLIYLLKLPLTQFSWDFPQSSDGLTDSMVLYCFLLS